MMTIYDLNISSSLALILANSPLGESVAEKAKRLQLDGFRNHDFHLLLAMTVLVAIGVTMEGPEIVHEARNAWFQCRGRRARHRSIAPWITLIGALGWLLVAVGVAGEGYWEVQVSHDDEAITSFDEQKLGDAEKSAADANKLAGELGVKVDELPSFVTQKEGEINGDIAQFQKYANRTQEQSSDALDRLKTDTAALNRARDDATAAAKLAEAERAAVEAEIKRLKTPRSIVNSNALATTLSPFSGTEYVMNVFLDQESTEFIKSVARELDAAGWIRKQPKVLNIGNPTMRIDFGQGAEYVPSCIDTGVSLRVRTRIALAVLQSTPLQNEPRYIQAALILKNSIASSISPEDAGNVAAGIIDPEPGDEGPITICVGKKP